MKCIDCKFFDSVNHVNPTHGECRRYSPKVFDIGERNSDFISPFMRIFPVVLCSDFCGEFVKGCDIIVEGQRRTKPVRAEPDEPW
jgi:hypothetical protein